MNISGKKVTLRAIEREDLTLMKEMMNSSEIERLVVGWAFPISDYQQNQWYEANIGNRTDLRFIIETEDGAVGLTTLTDIDWKNRSAFHGIKLADRKDRSKGIGTDTVMAIMRYAFEELQLNRLDTAILHYNEASRHLYCNKCGWSMEGTKRKCIYKGGEYHDLHLVGILKEEYEELINRTNYWMD